MASPKKFKATSIRKSTIEVSSHRRMDFYHALVSMPWLSFLALFVTAFLLINALFGALYYAGDSAIGGLVTASYVEHFFFSVQTLATIGYGGKFPQTLYADVLVTIEAMIGLLGLGLFAAIAFAKLSIPKSQIIFSKVAVVAPFEGVPTLMFRVANERNNHIIGAEIELSMFIRKSTAEGLDLRRIFDLRLLRSRAPLLALTWLVFHPIDEKSPLWGYTPDALEQAEFALVATLKGLDETISQTVHAKHSYASGDIQWGQHFKDMFTHDAATGKASIDLRLIHDVHSA